MNGPRSPGFAHRRLDVYRCAMDLAVGVERLSQGLPRGYADLRDQVRRSAFAVVRHVAEGANRASPADKGARFTVARGECAECDASLETIERLGIGRGVVPLRRLADRVGAMLTGLIRRETARQWADILAEAEFYGLEIDRPEWVVEKLRALRRRDAEEAARRWIHPDELKVTVGRPKLP